MKLLADMGVARSTVEALRTLGHDAIHLKEQQLQRLSDREILDKARSEGRVVLTFDLDFGDRLAAGLASSPSAVILRVANQTPAWVTPRVIEVVEARERELMSGAIVIVEDWRSRCRRLPIIPSF